MIDNILNTKKINYSSNLNGENLLQKIGGIFEKNDSSFFGKFTAQNKFEIYGLL